MARGAFWTIIVDDQPTAFRSPVREDLLPTLKQLQRQHPSAAIKWFQRGRLWETPGDAMDATKPPRRGPGWRPGGEHKDPRAQYKVPRDVKRARWAAQASEGRGPWVKDRDARAGSRDGQPGRAPGGGGRAWSSGDREKSTANRPPRKPFVARDRDTGEGSPRPRKTDRPTGDRASWKPKGGAPWRQKPADARVSRPSKPSTGAKRDVADAGSRPDWRGDRRPRPDATPRSGGNTSSAPARKGRSWRVGELPPADRKRKKTDE